jgi:arginine-tRNA-protein transferase
MCTKEKFDLYEKYQKVVHKSPGNSIGGYKSFLCNSPLYDPQSTTDSKMSHVDSHKDDARTIKDEGVFPKVLGSYHMLHRIDGELAMVGVLDITDTCVSSVYLYYDPKWEFLSPGHLSAIREIEYVRKCMTLGAPETFHYYYMGLYFQNC